MKSYFFFLMVLTGCSSNYKLKLVDEQKSFDSEYRSKYMIVMKKNGLVQNGQYVSVNSNFLKLMVNNTTYDSIPLNQIEYIETSI